MSRLVQARGLKPAMVRHTQPPVGVAPRAGAWIETADRAGVAAERLVAPRAGAWIETNAFLTYQYPLPASRLVQARGLKPPIRKNQTIGSVSRLVQARGLKLAYWSPIISLGKSRLVQARGLKRDIRPSVLGRPASRLVQARGLKPRILCPGRRRSCRASCRRVD